MPYLPGLVADLRGRVNEQDQDRDAIIGGKYIRSTVTDVPDLPVSSFSMSLNGGDRDRSSPSSTSASRRANKFRTMKPRSPSPRTAASARRRSRGSRSRAARPRPPRRCGTPRGRKATLKLTVERHPDAENIERPERHAAARRGARLKRMKGKGVAVKGIRRQRRDGPRGRQAHASDLEAVQQGRAQGDRHPAARRGAAVRARCASSPARASGRRCASRCGRATRRACSHVGAVRRLQLGADAASAPRARRRSSRRPPAWPARSRPGSCRARRRSRPLSSCSIAP